MIAIAVSPIRAGAFDISFYGQPLSLPSGALLTVASGVEPGVPVVFDLSAPDQITLRPAAKDEATTEAQPVFTFEWQEDKSARFYRLPDPAVLTRLAAENERDSADAEGKEFERQVLKQYLQDGAVLRACLPASKPGSGRLTFYIVVSGKGALEHAIVLPQGAASECILERAKTQTFDAPASARSFTAMANIVVTETAASENSASHALLEKLAEVLQRARESGEIAPDFARCPTDTSALRGLRRSEILESLGTPDWCARDRAVQVDCKVAPGVTYFITGKSKDATIRGGGFPELTFQFGSNDTIESVECRYSK